MRLPLGILDEQLDLTGPRSPDSSRKGWGVRAGAALPTVPRGREQRAAQGWDAARDAPQVDGAEQR